METRKAELQEKSSFCEQKEAKKLHPLSPVRHPSRSEGPALSPPDRFAPQNWIKSFCFLFVHKKKHLPAACHPFIRVFTQTEYRSAMLFSLHKANNESLAMIGGLAA